MAGTSRRRHSWWREVDFWQEERKRARPGRHRRRVVRKMKTAQWITRVRFYRSMYQVERPKLPWPFVLVCFVIAAFWLWVAR